MLVDAAEPTCKKLVVLVALGLMDTLGEEKKLVVVELSTTGGTSDARFIKDYCPVVEFGLSNRMAHKIDEHVATADLVALTAIYGKILERYFA